MLRFLGVFGGAVLVSGNLNLTRDVFSVDVNLFSVAVNAAFGFLVAALFRISTLLGTWE